MGEIKYIYYSIYFITWEKTSEIENSEIRAPASSM